LRKRAGALSSRGTINVDVRTNTMIVKDLPAFLDRAKELLAELDRATARIGIDARIVVTSRNFTRDLGIQWGTLNQQTAAFGNLRTLQLEADVGHVIVADGGDVLIVVIAEKNAQLGLVRLEAHRAAEALQ
jgi:type IV pilus assembly protein PilQ